MDISSTNYQILAACKDDQDDWLNDLLSQNDIDISFSDDNGDTALHYATQSGSLACLELLVRFYGIQINQRNKLGNTPLYYAVIYDDQEVALEMVNVLLDAGANPRIPNKNKESPLTVIDKIPNDEDMKDLLHAVLVDNDLDENQVDYEEDDDDIAINEDIE